MYKYLCANIFTRKYIIIYVQKNNQLLIYIYIQMKEI